MALNASKQLRKGNLQGLHNAVHSDQRQVLLSALDRAHVTSVKSALMGKFFLGKAFFLPQFRNFLSYFFKNFLHS
jgi:hypothetical protein